MSRVTPSAPTTTSLYRCPSRAFAATPSQIPDEPSGRRGSAPSLQKFQSPTTETLRAFGAQTANRTPPSSQAVGAESLVQTLVPPLTGEVEIDVAETAHDFPRLDTGCVASAASTEITWAAPGSRPTKFRPVRHE